MKIIHEINKMMQKIPDSVLDALKLNKMVFSVIMRLKDRMTRGVDPGQTGHIRAVRSGFALFSKTFIQLLKFIR